MSCARKHANHRRPVRGTQWGVRALTNRRGRTIGTKSRCTRGSTVRCERSCPVWRPGSPTAVRRSLWGWPPDTRAASAWQSRGSRAVACCRSSSPSRRCHRRRTLWGSVVIAVVIEIVFMCVVARRGAAWRGVARRGVARCGVARCGVALGWYAVSCC